MTENQQIAKEYYSGIIDKERVSEEFLYNAICYFHVSPEKVVEMLNELPPENADQLNKAFQDCREAVRKSINATLQTTNFSEAFHDPEIEDILFYQFAHGLPIG